MPMNAQWIPVEDAFELQLVDRLVHEGRWFTKALRYNLARIHTLPSATLLDAAGGPCALIVDRATRDANYAKGLEGQVVSDGENAWLWRIRDQPMPALPAS